MKLALSETPEDRFSRDEDHMVSRVGVIKIVHVIVVNCNLITLSKVIVCNCNSAISLITFMHLSK